MNMLIPPPETILIIHCPKCRSEATLYVPYRMFYVLSGDIEGFEEAVRFYPGRVKMDDLPAQYHARRGETLERRIVWYFPDLYFESPWKGWNHQFGVGVCHTCMWRGKYTLQGDQDHYYRIAHHGRSLALRSREDVITLIDFIGSKERDYRKYAPQFWRLLRRVPKAFITAKARQTVLKKLNAALVGESHV